MGPLRLGPTPNEPFYLKEENGRKTAFPLPRKDTSGRADGGGALYFPSREQPYPWEGLDTGMMPLIIPEVVMNIRKSDVSWEPTLVRVEYLDDAGAPYYCSFTTREQPSMSRAAECFSTRPTNSRMEDGEAQAESFVVVMIAVFVENGTKGMSRGPPTGSGQSD
jgi:hypothetical protein